RAAGRRLRARARVASVATGPRGRGGSPLDDAERLPRPRAPELDLELRPLRARRLAREARARDRRTVVGSHSEVRVMTRRNATTKARQHFFALVCVLWLMSGSAFAATKAIRAGKVVDASGKVQTNVV